ncbi:hypothetical protein ABF226_000862 [Flavobacterium psychrophilum]
MDKLEIKKGILQSEPLNLTNSTKTEQTTKEDFEINTFNYKYFFDNIDNISYTHQLKLIQKETNNFDVFLLGQFYTEFFILVTSYKLDRIKFNDIDISFSQDIEANVFSDDNSLLSYIHYSIKKGKLIRKRTNIKFDLIEPIEIKYFMGLYDVLHHLEKIILNYATKEQLNNLEQKTLQLEPEAIDLSDSSATEKIIYLQKLGVIDFLRNKQPFLSSINRLATVLSAITGEKTGTIQPMLNPIISKEAGQKNNPLNSSKPVNKVQKQLNDIGFNLNETI